MKYSTFAYSVSSLYMMAVCSPVMAAEASTDNVASKAALSDIIVTAQKTVSTLQKTPISVSVVSGEAVQTGTDHRRGRSQGCDRR